MSTGHRRMIENTRERVVSGDVNRLQTFLGGDANNVLRGSMLRPIDDFSYVGTTFTALGPASLAIDQSVPTAPSFGGVVDGLMVVVPAAGTSFLVTPGELIVIDPDGQPGSSNPNPANPDDPICKYVSDAGISIVGTLNWTPNPGPGTRVDVIEVQRADVVTESDNRDIYDQSTGAFTPQLVTKVAQGELQYRVRLGVPSGGLPAPALGWFPLAVVTTPAGALNLDTCGVWDVRDLLSDRAATNAQVMPVDGRRAREGWAIDTTSAPGSNRLSGQNIRTFGGYKFGGSFLDVVFGASYVDLANASYQAAGFVPAANLPYYVYAMFPPGYVRWVPYYYAATPGAGGRTPGSYRGVLCLTQIPPLLGIPTAPVAMPTASGLGVSSVFGQMVASGVYGPGPTFVGAVSDGRMTYNGGTTGGVPWRTTPGVILGATARFALLAGQDYPPGAKRIKVQIGATFAGFAALGQSANVGIVVQLYNNATATYFSEIVDGRQVQVTRDASATAGWSIALEIPIPQDGYTAVPAIDVLVLNNISNISAAAPALSAATLFALGWDCD